MVYFHLRVDKEGCDQSVLMQDLGLSNNSDNDEDQGATSNDARYIPIAIATDITDKNQENSQVAELV